jgi:hypothetical protein
VIDQFTPAMVERQQLAGGGNVRQSLGGSGAGAVKAFGR